ncbi:plasmid partitioning protein RepB [Salipiger marinus]|uniref:Chromosome partitioning protein, ParB family n=1 Tax=Salipiger marinus TaxID=555512 RepID=A0A1G8KIA8_9RHOB|nr:plasmid partitioning protein RepB [Salipiger marinus]SDI43125.1 chromosome partitioning protein, ParB family [Salipiger marinus]
MARRNIFTPPPPPAAADPAEQRTRFPATGAMTGMKSTLRDLSSNAVREIDPALIDAGGPKDRLEFSDADVADLAESIRAHGQQVPIMVRPLPDQPGRFRIVYGRRRLRALRLLGQPAKALVRSLDDAQAILAQGQENSLRLDPSFIEKALFAAELADTGYEQAVILDALAVDKPMLSRMNKVARALPAPVVHWIGPAHGVGRRRWEDLANVVLDRAPDLDALVTELADSTEGLGSDDRFSRLADRVARAAKVDRVAAGSPPALPVSTEDGVQIAEIRDTPRALTLKFSASDQPEFTRWMRENAAPELLRLYAAWKAGTD